MGHTDGDANDDTLFSGEMPGAVRASCVIRMEPHEVRAVQPTRGQTTAQTTQLVSGGSGGDRGHLSPRVARSAWSALPNAREGEKLYGSFLNGAEGLRPRGELGQGAVVTRRQLSAQHKNTLSQIHPAVEWASRFA